MSLSELLPLAQELPVKDKLRLIQALAAELAGMKEPVPDVPAEPEVPIWTPLGAFEAADALESALKRDELSEP